jgi:hypothetical protein
MMSRTQEDIGAALNAVAGIYLMAVIAGVCAVFASFGLKSIPNLSFNIGMGLLSGHAVLIAWFKYRNNLVTWKPLALSLGSFFAFLFCFGGILAASLEASSGANADVDRIVEAAKLMLGYGLPVLLPVHWLAMTLAELEK